MNRWLAQLVRLTPGWRNIAALALVFVAAGVAGWCCESVPVQNVAVIDEPLGRRQMNAAVMQLEAEGISTTVAGDRLLVPADRRIQALAILSYTEALAGTRPPNPFDTEKTKREWAAKKRTESISASLNPFGAVAADRTN